ncbi:GntR family transcriptional regulator [Stella humosa]|uniref:GntR family transcriptional regulator n=1 Tax=Stella humosa TaxID=94 RepID=A0A3N1KWY6_9PROT|nr:PLP-dependent aminotransferase family protein [Stella humosa]ROP83110.1 GntR family transcriptional regulator [Stella humosa]BBK30113.1 GntR family transcriptional regulator [Stella humosa]
MHPIAINPGDPTPLVDQVVGAIRRQIDDRFLRAGAKLPSIRKFADVHGISRFTAVEAYDRLVALGYLEARRGAGFFTTAVREEPGHLPPTEGQKRNEELVSLIRRLLHAGEGTILAGGPWLPNAWLDEMGLRRSLAAVARRAGPHLIEYGNPFGYLPLREHLALLLSERGIAAGPAQILLTHGTSQALDLIMRQFVRPGDAVLVDDPGYYNLFGNLRLHGARLLAVPRNPDGPDLDALERLAAEHRPRIYFTQSVLQNPTGTDMSPHVGFRVLQLAGRHDFLVVEDDIFCDLQTRPTARLASLDQLDRVIYARSFSKTLSGSLRVGFVAARQSIVDDLADIKMLSNITSSQFVERVLYAMLVDGHYRKFLTRLHKRIAEARITVIQAFERIGLELFTEPDAGMFVWARFPHIADAMPLTRAAAAQGIVLAPGVVFRPNLEPSPWMRFNVTACDDPRLLRWLEQAARGRDDAMAAAAE